MEMISVWPESIFAISTLASTRFPSTTFLKHTI